MYPLACIFIENKRAVAKDILSVRIERKSRFPFDSVKIIPVFYDKRTGTRIRPPTYSFFTVFLILRKTVKYKFYKIAYRRFSGFVFSLYNVYSVGKLRFEIREPAVIYYIYLFYYHSYSLALRRFSLLLYARIKGFSQSLLNLKNRFSLYFNGVTSTDKAPERDAHSTSVNI